MYLKFDFPFLRFLLLCFVIFEFADCKYGDIHEKSRVIFFANNNSNETPIYVFQFRMHFNGNPYITFQIMRKNCIVKEERNVNPVC